MNHSVKYLVTMALAASLASCGTETEPETPKSILTGCAMDSIEAAETVSNEAFEKPAISSAADIRRRLAKLASDEFEGRAPGTPGGIAASQYIADEMKAAGLEPMGSDCTYFQPVELTSTTLQPSSFMTISSNGEPVMESDIFEGVTNSVFWSKRVAPSLNIKNSDVVFVGYGVVAPEYGWNDYEGLDVKGKTVVMLVNDPGYATKDPELFKGNAMTYYGRWTYKFEEAGRQGAAAAIVIHEEAPASYPWEVVSGGWTGPQDDLNRPDGGANRTLLEGWISSETARSLMASAGQDFDLMKIKAKQEGFKAIPMDGLTLDAQIDQKVEKTVSRNVVGAVPGTKYPDEYVLYMAHWDHMGMKDMEGDGIYNGAVDNATGTATVLEIGEAFVQQGRPERSAIFVAVTAEESGLLGSAYYAADPIVPLNKTVAGINIDGILPVGQTKNMVVIGYGSSELEDRLADILKPRDMRIEPDPTPEAGYFYRSDHISLAKLGVPMIYSDSGNDHIVHGKKYGEDFDIEYRRERYHKPSDEYDDSWDLSGIEQTGEILFQLGYDLANSQDWPNWYDGGEFRPLRDAMLEK